MAIDDGRVVSNFIVQALRGEALTIFGSGSQTRSFCFVDDLISGILILMASNSEFTGPINLGNPTEFTVLELAEKIIKITKSKSRLDFHELPLDDPRQKKPDISLAKSQLDWQPEIMLDEGLELTIDYFKRLLSSG
jgi:UDP-glucuronate decarboxylase